MKELILQNDDDTNRLGKDIAKELKAAEILKLLFKYSILSIRRSP
ncbi:hypothetical protein OAO95_00895 [bacterium]|nr:hypothetical protein [bacterium]